MYGCSPVSYWCRRGEMRHLGQLCPLRGETMRIAMYVILAVAVVVLAYSAWRFRRED